MCFISVSVLSICYILTSCYDTQTLFSFSRQSVLFPFHKASFALPYVLCNSNVQPVGHYCTSHILIRFTRALYVWANTWLLDVYNYHTFTWKYVHFAYRCDSNIAFKLTSLLCSAKGVIMGHVGDTAFLPGQKTHITTFKCMINRLWYGNFHIIPHIDPWHISAFGPRADMGSQVDMAYDENCHIIISIYRTPVSPVCVKEITMKEAEPYCTTKLT